MVTNEMTAKQLIQFIANDYVELSQEKVRWQRDEYIKACREWLKHNKEQKIDRGDV